MRKLFICFLILFIVFGCDGVDNEQDYYNYNTKSDENSPWLKLRNKLDDLLRFELKCDSIIYRINENDFEEEYVQEGLNILSLYRLEGSNDSVLFNKEYDYYDVPLNWATTNPQLEKIDSKYCTVNYTKLVESLSKDVIFTYAYIPHLNARYKILMAYYTKKNEWELLFFGM